jgi:hypothetical protein
MAKGKAATEALLAKHLTPAEREAEKQARMAVWEVRVNDRERATFVRNALHEHHRLRRELEGQQLTPDEVERALREHAVASCIERAMRGFSLPSDASIVEEAKRRALEIGQWVYIPENFSKIGEAAASGEKQTPINTAMFLLYLTRART